MKEMRNSTKKILVGVGKTIGAGCLVAAGNAAMKTLNPIGIAGGFALHIGGLCVGYVGACDIVDGIQMRTDEKLNMDDIVVDIDYKEVEV